MNLSFKWHDGVLHAYDETQEVGHLILDTSDDQRPSVSLIYVEPEARRNGVGLALCLETAKRLGAEGLKLYAAEFQHEKILAGWEMAKQAFPDNVGCENGRLFLSYL